MTRLMVPCALLSHGSWPPVLSCHVAHGPLCSPVTWLMAPCALLSRGSWSPVLSCHVAHGPLCSPVIGIYFAEDSSKSNQYVFGISGRGCSQHSDKSCYTCERYVCTYAHGPAWVDEAENCLKAELPLPVAARADWPMCSAVLFAVSCSSHLSLYLHVCAHVVCVCVCVHVVCVCVCSCGVCVCVCVCVHVVCVCVFMWCVCVISCGVCVCVLGAFCSVESSWASPTSRQVPSGTPMPHLATTL